jgi:hypothetical protein
MDVDVDAFCAQQQKKMVHSLFLVQLYLVKKPFNIHRQLQQKESDASFYVILISAWTFLYSKNM